MKVANIPILPSRGSIIPTNIRPKHANCMGKNERPVKKGNYVPLFILKPNRDIYPPVINSSYTKD